jgi:hypothetical protein
MSRNVACAGGGDWLRDHGRIFRVTDAHMLPIAEHGPCGWKGERFPWDHRPEVGPWGHTEAGMIAKPCPRCGGTVKILPGFVGLTP